MENNEVFKSLILKIQEKYYFNQEKTFIIYDWYNKQIKLLNEFLKSNNEITNDEDKIQLLYILYENELKEKINVKKIKDKHNYFRKTLKKKIDQ